MNTSSVITKTFNAVLFLYVCISAGISYLFEPGGNIRVPWDAVYDWSPGVAIVTGLLIVLIMVFWWAALVKIFWNKFISDIFKVRPISYDESLAIILMIIAIVLT